MRGALGTILGAVVGFASAWVLSDNRSHPATPMAEAPAHDGPTRFRIGRVEANTATPPPVQQGPNVGPEQDPFLANPSHETARREDFESVVRTHDASRVEPQHSGPREEILSTSVLPLVTMASSSRVSCRGDSCLVTFQYESPSDAEADLARVTEESGRFLNCRRRGLLDDFEGQARFRLLFLCDERF